MDRQGSEVGDQHHVSICDVRVAADRRAIKGDAVFHGIRKPVPRDLDAFEFAKEIREQNTNELNALFFQRPLQLD